jgi:hypothetical protein
VLNEKTFAFEKPVDDKMKFHFIFQQFPDISQIRRRVLSKQAPVNSNENHWMIQKSAIRSPTGLASQSHSKNEKNSLSIETREFCFRKFNF